MKGRSGLKPSMYSEVIMICQYLSEHRLVDERTLVIKAFYDCQSQDEN